MDDLLKKLHDYSRLLELEDSIPYWEAQVLNLREQLQALNQDRRQKEIDFSLMKEPNFFQRLLGKNEEKKEKLAQELREITASQSAAQWDLEGLEKKIAKGKEELTALAGAREAYEAAKQEMVLTADQEKGLRLEEISAFAPVALETVFRALEALENARSWMGKDALSSRVREGNRKMEYLYLAQSFTRRLQDTLTVMPEGVASPGSYFANLYDYICGATSEFKQLDRLNNAVEQLCTVRNQLRQYV